MFVLLKKIIPQNIKESLWHYIDYIKIFFGPFLVPHVNINEYFNQYKNLRIAFVKQEIATDLYTNPEKKGADLIFSTIHRSGPAGLFTKFNTSFFILKNKDVEECNMWKLRPIDCGGPPLQTFLQYKNEIAYNKNGDRINEKPQKEYAIEPENIDWNNYDIVVSCDISVPEKIVSKYPNVKWAYMFFEPLIRYYAYSHKSPIYGYNLFLNQKFRSVKLNPKPKYHEIDFPYHLHYFGVFHDLLNIPINHFKKEGIFLENRTATNITNEEMKKLEKFGAVRFPKEELLKKVILKEMKSKYFFSLRRGARSRIWGNGIIEAVACGCLAFGNPAEYGCKDLFTPYTSITSFDEFIKKVNYLEKNPKKFNKELNKQRKLLDYLCFYRPMKELIEK